MAHKGATRGKSRNSATTSGRPVSRRRAERANACRNGGRPAGCFMSRFRFSGRWANTSAATSNHTAMPMASAVTSDCECRKLASTRKNPRKKTTVASRRVRSSRVLSADITTSSVTPAEDSSKDWWLASVPAEAPSSASTSNQRDGSAPLRQASHARQASAA
jgi:hypothetical protein